MIPLPQTLLDWYTGLLVFVGAVQAVILFLTIRAINRQTTTAQNSERAWVMANLEGDTSKWADRKTHIVEGSGTGGDTTGIWVVLSCMNEGKSPAWIDEKRVKFEIVRVLSPKPNLEAKDIIQVGPEPIGTGNALPHTNRIPLVPEAIGHVERGTMPVIYGLVRYRDIFDRTHTTTFGYRITPSNQLVRLEGCPEYNKNT